jgi:magnesium-transporting ATPase (P-type)
LHYFKFIFCLFRHNLDLAAQTAYFVGVVIAQFANLYGNKTTRRSVFQQGIFANRFMVFSVLFTIALTCFLLYVPTLNRALNLSPNRFLWWLPAVPFFFYLFAFNEARKFFIRKYPHRFPARQLTY